MSATLLESIVEPFTACLTAESAQKIIDFRADDALQNRVDELAEKVNIGQITHDEQQEYDRYLAAFHFITVMQAKARRMLQS